VNLAECAGWSSPDHPAARACASVSPHEAGPRLPALNVAPHRDLSGTTHPTSHDALRIADTEAWNAATGRRRDVREGSPYLGSAHPLGTAVVREYFGTVSEPKACTDMAAGGHNDEFEMSTLVACQREEGWIESVPGSAQAVEVLTFANSRGEAWTWLSM
jgi:hypothetical protein